MNQYMYSSRYKEVDHNLLCELSELRQLVLALVQGFALIVDVVDQHPQGEHVAGLTTAVGQTVFRCHIIQAWLCHPRLVRVPFMTRECGLWVQII